VGEGPGTGIAGPIMWPRTATRATIEAEAPNLMSQYQQLPDRQVVGQEYSGKWVAWDDEGIRIVASGRTYEETREQALASGVQLPGLEFVPPSDRAFVGGV
jgi:hypothetical protein